MISRYLKLFDNEEHRALFEAAGPGIPALPGRVIPAAGPEDDPAEDDDIVPLFGIGGSVGMS